MKYDYDDKESRELVINFFKETYNEEYEQMSNSYFKTSLGNECTRKNGLHDIDLVLKTSNKNDVQYIEVQRAEYNYEIWQNDKNYVNIVVSKYYKYFLDQGEKATMVFVQTKNGKCTGQLCIINGKNIKDFTDINNQFNYPSKTKKSGMVNVYRLDKKYCTFVNVHSNLLKKSVNNKSLNINLIKKITVTYNTIKDWNKLTIFKRSYSINKKLFNQNYNDSDAFGFLKYDLNNLQKYYEEKECKMLYKNDNNFQYYTVLISKLKQNKHLLIDKKDFYLISISNIQKICEK